MFATTNRHRRRFLLNLRQYSQNTISAIQSTAHEDANVTPTDPQWNDAKPYSEIPGPSIFLFPFSFLPGGKFHKLTLLETHRTIRDTWGPVVRLTGILRRPDTVFVFDPDDVEKVFRTQGVWPGRQGLNTFVYYRKKVRPDVFKGRGGLVTEQGKAWADIRTTVNPILMKISNVRYYVPQVNDVADDFIQRINDIRDSGTLEMPKDFHNDIRRWALETTSIVSINKRLGLLSKNTLTDPRPERLLAAVKKFFDLEFELDVKPSLWLYFTTPQLKRMIKCLDTMTDLTQSYIDEATEKLKFQPTDSILNQLLKKDPHVAKVMVMDFLIAGMDTTSALLINCIYQLAKNPEKQEKLRAEVRTILPEKDSKLTEKTLLHLPYLRACIKESLRITAVTGGNARDAGQDIVLSGYQIPKGTNIVMNNMIITNDEKYFPKSDKFLPERWLRDHENTAECPLAKNSHPFAYLPFGFGSRTCIGRRVAELMLEVTLSKLLRNFHIEWHYSDIKYMINIINTPISELTFKFIDIK